MQCDDAERLDSLSVEASIQLTMKDFVGARATADKMSSAPRRARQYSLIAASQARAGDVEGATTAIQQAEAVGIDKGDSTATYSRWDTYRSLAQAYARRGRIAETIAAIEKLGKLQSNQGVQQWKAIAQAKAGRFGEARATAAGMGPLAMEFQSMAYRVIAEEQARTGDFAGARETAGDVYMQLIRGDTFSRVADLQMRKGEWADLLGYVESTDSPLAKAYSCLGAARAMIPEHDESQE